MSRTPWLVLSIAGHRCVVYVRHSPNPSRSIRSENFRSIPGDLDIDWVKTRVESRVQFPADDTRFQQMYATNRDAVWSYVVRRVARDDVDDAVAEVFTVAWRKIDRSPDFEQQLPWLYGISKNVVRNVNRSATRRQRLWTRAAAMPASNSPAADIQVVRSSEDSELLDAVSRLRPMEQELLRLRTWEELPIKDIAAVVGVSPKSVESRLVRIRKNLAKMLAVPASPMHVVRPGLAKEGGEQ